MSDRHGRHPGAASLEADKTLWPIRDFQIMLKGDLSAGKGREPGWRWDRDPTGMWPGARGSRTPWEAGVRFKSTARTPGAPTQHHHPQRNLSCTPCLAKPSAARSLCPCWVGINTDLLPQCLTLPIFPVPLPAGRQEKRVSSSSGPSLHSIGHPEALAAAPEPSEPSDGLTHTLN